MRKEIAPHMYVIFRTYGYCICRGNPVDVRSKLIAFGLSKQDAYSWAHGGTMSLDHIVDTTGDMDVPSDYSDFYLQVIGVR